MSEHPYWPVIELRECANGWVVMRGRGWNRDEAMGPSEVYVFNYWDECQAFMALATNPRGPASGEGT